MFSLVVTKLFYTKQKSPFNIYCCNVNKKWVHWNQTGINLLTVPYYSIITLLPGHSKPYLTLVISVFVIFLRAFNLSSHTKSCTNVQLTDTQQAKHCFVFVFSTSFFLQICELPSIGQSTTCSLCLWRICIELYYHGKKQVVVEHFDGCYQSFLDKLIMASVILICLEHEETLEYYFMIGSMDPTAFYLVLWLELKCKNQGINLWYQRWPPL